MSVEDAKQYWTQRSTSYKAFESMMRQSWTQVLFNLPLSNENITILEIGCGRGNCSKAITERMSATSHLFATDLSPGMVENTKALLRDKAQVKEANALDLIDFNSESIDVYIANMTLHLVPDPLKMIAESCRVLKKNGVAAFSVWGNPNRSNFFTIPLGETHQNFKYGNLPVKEIKDMFFNVGFQRVVLWPSFVVAELWDGNSATGIWNEFSELGQDPTSEWWQNLSQKFQLELDNGKPIGLESLIIIAKK